MSEELVLKISNLTKRFTGMVALDHINMEVQKKEIRAIVGENGAGKSTFCKVLTGIYQPDEGEMIVFGQKAEFKSPKDSLNAGIGMLYQERNLIGHLTGAQNIALGYEPKRGFLIDETRIKSISKELCGRLGIDVPLNVPVSQLGAGTQQIIEILRAFFNNPKFLILDEPTASLGEGEIAPFLQFVKTVVTQMGISIIFISHKIEEVFEVADKISVFTEGKSVLTADKAAITQEECIKAMLRKGEIKPITVNSSSAVDSKILLQVDNCIYDGKEHLLNFKIHEREMVGFYGLVGSGRTECAEAICGLRPMEKFEIMLDNEKMTNIDINEMLKKGIILTPEKRANGVLRGLNITENICSLFWNKFLKKFGGLIDFDKAKKFATQVIKKHGVKCSSINQGVNELSGGNIQKIIIGRSMELENVKLIILDEPTAGLDLGAKNEVYLKMRNLVEKEGKAVIFISSELEELLTTCDRLYVFNNGNISKEFKRNQFEKTKILDAAIRRAS